MRSILQRNKTSPSSLRRAPRRVSALAACLFLAMTLAPLSAASVPALDAPAAGQDHDRVEAELQYALRATEAARAEANSAKRQFDDFVAQHFEAHRSRAVAAAADSPAIDAQPSQAAAPSKPVVSPLWQKLHDQLEELTATRDQLLDRFTSAHPEVVDIESRIAALSKQLADFGPPSSGGQSTDSGAPTLGAAADQRLAERLKAEQQEHRAVAEQYERVFSNWQAAEQNLRIAVANENAAAERVAALRPPIAEPSLASEEPLQAAPVPTVLTSAPAATELARPQSVGQEHGSQPLALAALLIALAVAALAAVRLARSDAVFATIDDVAAALAVPVVGVIPAADATAHQRLASAPLARGLKFACELVLAFLVFAAVAYCVQNLAYLVQFCKHPLDAIHGAGFFGN